MTLKKDVEELLKSGWYSNYQLQMEAHSGSADRAARNIRQNPPEGYARRLPPLRRLRLPS